MIVPRTPEFVNNRSVMGNYEIGSKLNSVYARAGTTLRIETWPRRLRARFAFPPNQITVGLSVRAVLAVALPLFALKFAGLPMAGLYVALGALQIAIADNGGPYRDRLLSIVTLSLLLLPEAYFIGTQVGMLWWAAALTMFALAFAGGMLRSLGAMGLPLGMVIGASFLMGALTEAPPAAALVQTAWFFGGCAWAGLLTLAAWRLRPYLALQRQVGGALDAAARLIEAVPRGQGRELEARELAVRNAIEQARTALGTTRTMAPATNPTLARLFALLYVPSRLTMIALDLVEFRDRPVRESAVLALFDAAVAELARETAAAARAVIDLRPWAPGGELDQRIAALARMSIADPDLAHGRDVVVEALRAGATRLGEAAAASDQLARGRRRDSGWLPPLGEGARLRELARIVRGQFSPRSTIFRHALRLAVVAAVAMAIEIGFKLPHGIWLTLTVLVVMQPDFGATRIRAVARAGGTFAGVLVAGIVLVTIPWPLAREGAVAMLIFLTVFTLRFRYGFFVACLTPLVILLLSLYKPGQGWDFVLERLGETLGGTVLAILGSLLLWPSWAGRHVSAQFAEAVGSMAKYLHTVFTAVAGASGVSQAVFDARREAELAVTNAESALQTMLAEPRRIAGEHERYFQINAHLTRLVQHLGALAARLELGLERVPALAPLGDAWAGELAAAARRLAGEPPRAETTHAAPPDLAAAPAGLAHLIGLIGGAVEALAEEADSCAPQATEPAAATAALR